MARVSSTVRTFFGFPSEQTEARIVTADTNGKLVSITSLRHGHIGTSQLITKSSRFTPGLSTIPSRNPRRKNDRKHDVSVHVTTWGTRVHAQADAVGIGNFSVVRL